MTNSTAVQQQPEVFGALRKNWGWMLAFGIIMVILGSIGLGMTAPLTLVSVITFGFLLLFGSGVQLAQVFSAGGWKGRLGHLLIALLYLLAGAVIIADPVMASVSLTLTLAFCLVCIGLLRAVIAIQMRTTRGWGWTLASGILTIVLGIMIMARWPSASLWVIGMFVAIEMIFAGWSQIVIALAARQQKPA